MRHHEAMYRLLSLLIINKKDCTANANSGGGGPAAGGAIVQLTAGCSALL